MNGELAAEFEQFKAWKKMCFNGGKCYRNGEEEKRG